MMLKRISKEAAIDIAQAECGRRGIPWRLPIRVYRGLFKIAVVVGGDARPAFATVDMRARDGEIISVRSIFIGR